MVQEAEALGAIRRRVARHNQDAFDAAVTALALGGAADLVGQLERGRADADLREGTILLPELG